MLTAIEAYIIDQVKKKRLAAGLSQLELSQKMEMSDSFISHVESSTKRAKYNINHINKLALVFMCSPKDFLPKDAL